MFRTALLLLIPLLAATPFALAQDDEAEATPADELSPALVEEINASLDGERIAEILRVEIDRLDGSPAVAGDPAKPPVRNAEVSELVDAIFKQETLRAFLERMKVQAIQRVLAWKPGTKAVVVSATVGLAAGLVTGILQTSGLQGAQDLINYPANVALGAAIPGLSVRADFVSPNKTFMVNFDLTILLKKHGF